MKIIQAPRASAILYNLLVSQKTAKPWLLPANICPIVPITFMKAKIPFEFVDISAQSLHMDLDQAETRMKKRDIGGLLYAHTYGEESTPVDFFTRVKSLNPEMLIVDDRCLCAPSSTATASVDVVLFSTGYAKIVELESGGYALFRDEVIYQPVSLPFEPLHHAALEEQYKSSIQSRSPFAYRDSDWLMTDAELIEWKIYHRLIEVGLELSLIQRSTLNKVYSTRLPEEIQLPPQYQTWRFSVRVKNQTQVIKAIFDAGLFASTHYASLAGVMSEGRAPVAESLAGEAVNLFNDHHFTAEMAGRICEIIVKTARW